MIWTCYCSERGKFLKCTQIWHKVDIEDAGEKDLVGVDKIVFLVRHVFGSFTITGDLGQILQILL